MLRQKAVLIHLVVSVLVLVLAAPAAIGSSFGPDGVDFVGPEACCCADEADSESNARIQAACCCELRAPSHGADGDATAAILGGAFELPVAAVTDADTVTPGPRAPLAPPRPEQARGPPSARSLFAQHTSLLL